VARGGEVMPRSARRSDPAGGQRKEVGFGVTTVKSGGGGHLRALAR
jgi:hypothetical protein